MIEIPSLNETVTAVPGEKSRWDFVDGERMYIKPDRVIAFRVFGGLLQNGNSHTEHELVQMYFDGGFNVTTVFTKELEGELKKGNS